MDAKIKELLTHLSFFAEEGMGDPKLVEFAKQADALLLEVARKPNTQQPVAWRKKTGSMWLFFSDADNANAAGDAADPLYTAPPVPRDVLMAFGESVRVACAAEAEPKAPREHWTEFAEHAHVTATLVRGVDIAAIADRYASKVKPEPVTKQDTSELQPEGSDLDGLDLSHIPSDQLEALAKIYRISGIPLIHTGELEDKTMTAEAVFSMNVKWLEDVLADVTNINFPIHGEKHE